MIKSQILCLGEILWDNIAEELGKPLEAVKSWKAYPGGAPANVACKTTQLGISSAFIGCVGEDEAGMELVKILESQGVNTTAIQYHKTAPTRKVYVLREENGDRVFAGFGEDLPDKFADAFLNGNQLPEELFFQANFLVLGTLGLAYPQTREAIFKALELAENYNLKIIVDINWRPNFWLDIDEAYPLIKKLLTYADFVKLSAEEAQYFYQTTDAAAIAYRLESVDGVIITNGAEEVNYCLNGHEGKVTPQKVNVIDTTGAGDSFLAAFIHQLATKGMKALNNPHKIKEIITYACKIGTLTTTQLGA